jgi:hypothetical protein
MEGTGFLTDALAGGLWKGAKGLYNLSKAESNPFAHSPSTRTTPYLPPLLTQGGAYGRGFAGDMWRRGKKELGIKEPEPDTSHPIFDYTNRDAVEKRFYGV